jgi:hypothetical protein
MKSTIPFHSHRPIAAAILSQLVLTPGLMAQTASEKAQSFYVSPLGNDTHAGTKEKPFRTLSRARDAVRSVNQTMTSDINVYLRGGHYPITETLTFTPADSGKNGHKICYQAYGNEVPVFNGADKVTGWKNYKGRIFEAKLDRSTKLRTLIVNDKRAYMAHKTVMAHGGWGDYTVTAGQADWARKSGSKPDGVNYAASDVPEIANASDVEIMRNTTWNSNIVCVREVGTEGDKRVLKLQQPYGAIALNQGWDSGFVVTGTHTIYNAFEFLDEPGEFYFNKATGTLYYYSDKENMATAEVYAPKVGRFMTIKGDSKTERVENLSFKGIAFANSEAVLPMVENSSGKATVQAATWCMAYDDSDWHNIQYRAYDTTPCAIEVSSAKSIQFENCHLRHIGNDGIGFINDVVESQCVGNLAVDMGGSVFQVGHPQHLYEADGGTNEEYPPEAEGVCRNILIKNNVLFDLTTLFYGHAGITAYFVDGLKIEHNHIQGTQYSAVSLGWGWNNFDEISKPGNPTTTCRNNGFNNNRVYDCMRLLHDGGAFYTLGSQPNSEASGNYVKASTTHFQGVYHPDEGTAWYTGKNLVFEIVPGQENFELNDWKRKHDNHYSNIFSTSDKQQAGAPNCTITDLHVFPDANWPQEALDIIKNAGPEPKYQALLKRLPGVEFDSKYRYTVKTLTH